MKVAPFAGAVRATVGGWFGAVTVMLPAADVVVALSSSRATAVREYVPAGTLLHVTLYGLVASDPIGVWPA